MKKRQVSVWLALLAAFALVAASCGDDEEETAVEPAESSAAETDMPADDEGMDEGMHEDEDDMHEEEMAPEDDMHEDEDDMHEEEMAPEDDMHEDEDDMHEEEMMALPGEGVNVLAGRANWSSGYFQAELYKQLLEELGYSVSDPAEIELGPNNGYIAMAQGEMDYWPNSWYPGHLAWLAGELPDGSLVGDHVTIIGEEMIAGGLQGFLVTKSFADEFGVYTMDALNSNEAALAAFDATDSNPGNGIADIFGCPEDWTCDNIIENQIAFSGWDNLAQTKAGYDAMFAQAVDNVNEGVPMVIYTWTPTAYITQLRPGDNVYWMGVDDILDDSNPANQDGGEEHSQRGTDGTGGFASIGADQCPSAADQESGRCKIGWVAADILVTANNDFLAANPAAGALFEAVRLSVIDVSLANVAMGEGESPTDLATQWIADNRDLADEWVAAGMAAG